MSEAKLLRENNGRGWVESCGKRRDLAETLSWLALPLPKHRAANANTFPARTFPVIVARRALSPLLTPA
ncbi:hypothetical protein HaLaN_32276 [Haematococcus lacustris]|uniref:Uncharacterized protein n=1 Tax=Haematococcus lacustris TaxID=44745 RepID=A0A6A0AL11_HAELA|nr:hypothetical protein HaLaN_32276 [Haematococcus lacustris]